jgi:hypothetical protein
MTFNRQFGGSFAHRPHAADVAWTQEAKWFREIRLRLPQPVGLAALGTTTVGGPNFFNLEASLAKSIRFTERFNLDLRLEAFGVTNTPQILFTTNGGTAGGTTLLSTSFGHVTSASGGRTLQIGAKLNARRAG